MEMELVAQRLANLTIDDIATVQLRDFSEEVCKVMKEKVTEDGGIMKHVCRAGEGKKIEKGDLACVHWMMSGEFLHELLENTFKTKWSKCYRVGDGEPIIPALDLAIASMRVGEIAKFLVTNQYAFGKPPHEREIPTDGRVILYIEALHVYESAKDKEYSHMYPEELREVPFDDIYPYAMEMKLEGNELFKTEKYDVAITYYIRALDAVLNMQLETMEESSKCVKLSQEIGNNIALGYFKLERFDQALGYAEAAANINNGPDYLKVKSLYWCAKALYELKRYDECLEQITKAAELKNAYDPNISSLMELATKKIPTKEERPYKFEDGFFS